MGPLDSNLEKDFCFYGERLKAMQTYLFSSLYICNVKIPLLPAYPTDCITHTQQLLKNQVLRGRVIECAIGRMRNVAHSGMSMFCCCSLM